MSIDTCNSCFSCTVNTEILRWADCWHGGYGDYLSLVLHSHWLEARWYCLQTHAKQGRKRFQRIIHTAINLAIFNISLSVNALFFYFNGGTFWTTVSSLLGNKRKTWNKDTLVGKNLDITWPWGRLSLCTSPIHFFFQTIQFNSALRTYCRLGWRSYPILTEDVHVVGGLELLLFPVLDLDAHDEPSIVHQDVHSSVFPVQPVHQVYHFLSVGHVDRDGLPSSLARLHQAERFLVVLRVDVRADDVRPQFAHGQG